MEITLMGVLMLALVLLIIAAVVLFAFFLVDRSQVPEPWNWLLKGAVVIAGLLRLFGDGNFPNINL